MEGSGLPTTQSRKVISPIGEFNEDLEVSALIYPISTSWDPSLIAEKNFPLNNNIF